MNETSNISILGCGWLGFPLAKKLVANGFRINGSTTSSEKLSQLKNEGIGDFQIEIKEKNIEGDISGFLEGSEIVIIDIPPGLRQNPESNFPRKMSFLIDEVEKSTVKYVFFISSTAVFKDTESFPIYTEMDLPNGNKTNAKQLIEVENMLRENTNFQSTILRFGGLYGEGRHPVNYLSGRKNSSNPDAPVNLIHQKDCIAIIEKIITNQNWGKIFHGVHPNHPSKKDFYTERAKQSNLKPPEFSETKKSIGKIISSAKTQDILRYRYK